MITKVSFQSIWSILIEQHILLNEKRDNIFQIQIIYLLKRGNKIINQRYNNFKRFGEYLNLLYSNINMLIISLEFPLNLNLTDKHSCLFIIQIVSLVFIFSHEIIYIYECVYVYV